MYAFLFCRIAAICEYNQVRASALDYLQNDKETQSTRWNASNVPSTDLKYPVYDDDGPTIEISSTGQNEHQIGRRQTGGKSLTLITT